MHHGTVRSLLPLTRVVPHGDDAHAGIMAGDELLLFGSVDADNFAGLESLGTVTRASVGKAVRVLVNRAGATKLLRLVPQEWGGQGLLGCRVNPI